MPFLTDPATDRPSLDNARRLPAVPVSLFVLWHPDFADGPEMAEEIYQWLGGSNDDARRVGLGVPVHFRSEDWRPEHELPDLNPQSSDSPADTDQPEPASEVPPRPREQVLWTRRRRPIRLSKATHNIFVPLVDDHMVNDPTWRRDLVELAALHHAGAAWCSRRDRREPQAGDDQRTSWEFLLPVQVSRALAQLPPSFTKIQPVFLDRWADPAEGATPEVRDTRKVRLRRLLTQALVRILREQHPDTTTLPTSIFLSHAKMDKALGPGVAERLRDAAAGYGQIEVFYDENDLPSGGAWENRMLDSARGGAGFVAVLSDNYASRFWCRREIQQARTPTQVEGTNTWTVRPTVAAVTLASSWSRLPGDLATVPVKAWDEDHPEELLDHLFREALLSEVQRLYAQGLAASAGTNAHFVTWTPDATTMVRLHRDAGMSKDGQFTIFYPGYSFLPTEEDELQSSFGDRVQFRSFESLSDDHQDLGTAPEGPARFDRWPMVALSAGDAEDLAVLGYHAPKKGSSHHVNAAVLRTTQALLRNRVRLAYGGVLRDSIGFTRVLYDTVGALFPRGAPEGDPGPRDEDAVDPIGAAMPTLPLENFLAWPYLDRATVQTRASLTSLVRHHDIWPTDEEMRPSAADASQKEGWLTACALSRMRQRVALATVASVAIAGKSRGAAGFMPGVAEELLYACEAAGEPDAPRTERARAERAKAVRVVLIGAFGGVTREVARYLLSPPSPNDYPECLTYEGQSKHPTFARVFDGLSEDRRKKEQDRVRGMYARLREQLDGLREIAAPGSGLPGDTLLPAIGLTVAEWRELMVTDSPGRMRQLVGLKLARALHGRVPTP